MDRRDIIRTLLKHTNGKNYLEIGVYKGACFLEIDAPNKSAVDPALKITWRYKLHAIRHYPNNIFNKYFNLTSDAYFAQQGKKLEKKNMDVAFIDGLHTYAQTFIDLINCLKYINPNGAIALHDCSPATKAEAWPANSREHASTLNIPGFKGNWCGDSWKAIAHIIELNKTWNALDIFVLDCDFGVGVVIPKPNFKKEWLDNIKPEAAFEKLEYEFLDSNREKAINLKKESYLDEYINKALKAN